MSDIKEIMPEMLTGEKLMERLRISMLLFGDEEKKTARNG